MALALAIFGSSWVYNISPKLFFLDKLKPLVQFIMVPVLAAPHAAIAIGLAFLIAPSGWLARWLSPWLTNWTLPPDWATRAGLVGFKPNLGSSH